MNSVLVVSLIEDGGTLTNVTELRGQLCFKIDLCRHVWIDLLLPLLQPRAKIMTYCYQAWLHLLKCSILFCVVLREA